MRPSVRLLTAGTSALAVAAALLVASAPATAATAAEDPTVGLPPGVPDAALAPEPTLPAASGWPGSEAFPRTSGTHRLDAGALLWSDWLFDDTGARAFTYADQARTMSNGADVFRAGIAADADATYWRVDWNTLVDADVPIAAWTFDTDGDIATGAADWPAGARATSAGMETALVVTGSGARLVDLASGEETDVVAAGGALTVDTDARSFVVRVPRTELPIDGTWTVRLAAGLADADGGFAAAPESGDGTRIYNAAFRALEDENTASPGTWNEARQSTRLTAGDMSEFGLTVDWDALLAGATTPEPLPTGFSSRWFVSSVDLGQGRAPGARVSPGPALQPAEFYGNVQPYTVYVPTTYDPAAPAPLTILLHGGGGNHNAFLGSRQAEVYGPMCEERGSICVSPLGRGVGTWFINHGEVDIWEVWNRAAGSYSLDADRTVIAGFSMGGVGVTRMASNFPDVLAAAGVHSGAGYYNAPGVRDRAGSELRVENFGELRTFLDSGSRDIALANTRRWDAAAQTAGIPYAGYYYDGADHGMLSWLGFNEFADYVDGAVRTHAPAEVVYRFEPGDDAPELGLRNDGAYWIGGLESRDESARWSRVTGLSEALRSELREPEHTVETRTIDGRSVEVREQTRVVTGPAETSNVLSLTAENVATLAVDLDRAGLAADVPATLRLTTDGPTVVTLQRGHAETTVELAAGEHEITSPAAPAKATLVAGSGAVRVSWPAADSALAVTGYTVRDAAGEVVCSTEATTCRVEGVENGAPHAFTVTAANILGTSEVARSGWITPTAAPAEAGVSLTVSASMRCTAHGTEVAVHVLNKESRPVDVRIATPGGERKITALAPGAATHQVFAVDAGTAASATVKIAGYLWNGTAGEYTVSHAGYWTPDCG